MGETDIAGNRYQFNVGAGALSFTGSLEEIMAEKGCNSPGCRMKMSLGRVTTPAGRTLFVMKFMKDIQGLELEGMTFECESWQTKKILSAGQEDFVDEFIVDFQSAVQVRVYDEAKKEYVEVPLELTKF